MQRTAWLAVAATIVIVNAPGAGAQQTPPDVAVRVHVVDTARAPIAGADVSIVKGLQELVASGVTDDAGRVTLRVARDAGDLQIKIRKLGYQVTDQFVANPAAAAALDIVLRRAVQTLAPVAVTAEQDALRKSYYVDADVIANSTATLFDAGDIVRKLLPDVIYGRGGPDSQCGIQYVWVNGYRIINPPSNEMVTARIPGAPPIPTPQSAMSSSASGRRQPMAAISSVDMDVWLALATVKPEHIAEITYEDCFSKKVLDHTHANRALFIVLKKGVGYDPGRGSYVVEPKGPTQRSADAAPVQSGAAPAYRARLLGVFDDVSGDPVPHVVVTDSATGTWAETTSTGTLSLMFLPEGTSTLQVKKAGFSDLRLEVTISPRDTVPLTLMLSHAKDATATPAPPRGERTPPQGAPARSRPRAR